MKKILIGGLVMVMLLVVSGCGDDGDAKVVAREYRGEFRYGSTSIIITENEITRGSTTKLKAWTSVVSEEVILWYTEGYGDEIYGRFTDENTLVLSYRHGGYTFTRYNPES